MGKWEMHSYGAAAVEVYADGEWISNAGSRAYADRFIRAHNDDIAALESERDELKRRLDALRAEADPDALTICYMLGRAAR